MKYTLVLLAACASTIETPAPPVIEDEAIEVSTAVAAEAASEAVAEPSSEPSISQSSVGETGANASGGREVGVSQPRVSDACALGSVTVAACAMPFGPVPTKMPAPQEANQVITASAYGGSGSLCADAFTVTGEAEEEPWTKIWAQPAAAISTRCDCENTELVLDVRTWRKDNNLWCGYSCASGWAYCAPSTYCAGNCSSGSLCRFESLPNLTFLVGHKRVRGKWSSSGLAGSGVCSFRDAVFYRDDFGNGGSRGDGATIAAAAYDLRTGNKLPVTVGWRAKAVDGHEAQPPRGCCN